MSIDKEMETLIMSIDKEIETLIKKIELEELKLKLARVKAESDRFQRSVKNTPGPNYQHLGDVMSPSDFRKRNPPRKGEHRIIKNQMGYGYPLGVPGHPDVFLNKKK